MMSSISETIAQLRKAKGPCRFLDYRIADIIDPACARYGVTEFNTDIMGERHMVRSRANVPEFTGSLDAAFLLIPPRWTWTVWRVAPIGDYPPEYGTELYHPRHGTARSEDDAEIEVTSNAAISVCIAALVAMQIEAAARLADAGGSEPNLEVPRRR